jgi:hypothetical protein
MMARHLELLAEEPSMEAFLRALLPRLLRSAYPRVSPSIPAKKGFRDPDAIRGGTWEAFERVLQHHGYFETGLRKGEAARAIGTRVDPGRTSSRSFVRFCEAIVEATA